MASTRTGRSLTIKGHGTNYPLLTKEREVSLEEMIAHRFLGLVSFGSSGGSSDISLRLRPLFRWDGKWIPIQFPTEESFPRWRNAPENACAGTLWAFGVVWESSEVVSALPPECEADPALDDMQTGITLEGQGDDPSDSEQKTEPKTKPLFVRTYGEEPVFVYEVVRHDDAPAPVRSGRGHRPQDEHLPVDDIEAVRQHYFVQGSEATPLGPILADIKGKCVVGPLALRRDEDGKWRAEPQIAIIRAPFPPQSFHTLEMEGGKRKVRLASEDLPAIIAKVDFRSDDESIGEALTELLEAIPNLAHGITVQEILHSLSNRTEQVRSFYEFSVVGISTKELRPLT